MRDRRNKARWLGCVGSGISRREFRSCDLSIFVGRRLHAWKTYGRALDLKHGADHLMGKFQDEESEIKFAITGLVSTASDRLAVSYHHMTPESRLPS
jgi:hypothetical protein